MSTNSGQRGEPQDRVIEYRCSCWPYRNPAGGLFWGLALLLIGGVWLAGNIFGFDNWGEWLVPILFVAWGTVLLVGVRMGRGDFQRTK